MGVLSKEIDWDFYEGGDFLFFLRIVDRNHPLFPSLSFGRAYGSGPRYRRDCIGVRTVLAGNHQTKFVGTVSQISRDRFPNGPTVSPFGEWTLHC